MSPNNIISIHFSTFKKCSTLYIQQQKPLNTNDAHTIRNTIFKLKLPLFSFCQSKTVPTIIVDSRQRFSSPVSSPKILTTACSIRVPETRRPSTENNKRDAHIPIPSAREVSLRLYINTNLKYTHQLMDLLTAAALIRTVSRRFCIHKRSIKQYIADSRPSERVMMIKKKEEGEVPEDERTILRTLYRRDVVDEENRMHYA